jgi:acyl carrier protein
MTEPMSPDQARAAVTESVRQIVPDADLASIPDDRPLREALELDSLDLLSLVELLSKRAGRRIDEDEYPRLRTMASCIELLTQPTG